MKLDKDIYTIPEVVRILRLNDKEVREMLRNKTLSGFKMNNGDWRISKEAILIFLNDKEYNIFKNLDGYVINIYLIHKDVDLSKLKGKDFTKCNLDDHLFSDIKNNEVKCVFGGVEFIRKEELNKYIGYTSRNREENRYYQL
jgi:hypothetical protein